MTSLGGYSANPFLAQTPSKSMLFCGLRESQESFGNVTLSSFFIGSSRLVHFLSLVPYFWVQVLDSLTMSSNNQKAILVLCGAAAATGLYLLSSKKSGNSSSKDTTKGEGNQATAKVENPNEALATTVPAATSVTTTTTTSASVASVDDVASVGGREQAREAVAPVVEKNEPTKAMTSIVATSPISIPTPETVAVEEESVGGDENKKPSEVEATKSSTQGDAKAILSLKDIKSLDKSKDDDAVQVAATTTEIDHANGDDNSSNPAVDVNAILKARKNAAKNGKGKTKNTAASAAIKELKNSQQQQGKNKKKKSKNWQ